MGFIIHFYIIFGTNLLTGGPTQIVVSCLFQCFTEKEYQTESKRNETFRNVIFGTNMIQRTWSPRKEINEESTRQGGAPTPPRRALHPRGAHVAPPTYFFLLYIPIYPGTSYTEPKPISTAATFCTREIPSWGLFRRSAEGGIDHGGLLHQHHSLSDDV